LNLPYTLADGLAYIRAGVAAGLDVDDFAPRLSFFFGASMNFFMEGGEITGGAFVMVRIDAAAFCPEKSKITDASYPLPDIWLVTCSAGCVQ
jgi:methylmalonyl-CoA mutase